MDKELIERLAKEAGFAQVTIDYILGPVGLAKFAALVAEECAKIAENTYEGYSESEGDTGFSINGENSARDIRAKFPTPANTPKEPK